MTGTPALATFTSGVCAAFAALLIKLEVLVEMMSIGNYIHHIPILLVLRKTRKRG